MNTLADLARLIEDLQLHGATLVGALVRRSGIPHVGALMLAPFGQIAAEAGGERGVGPRPRRYGRSHRTLCDSDG
jgi:hypothetical protein